MISPLALLLLTSSAPTQPPPATAPATVIPFRTEAQPRIDPVFGDAGALRAAIDRFLTLQAGMDQVRDEFSNAVHQTLAALAPAGSVTPAKGAASSPTPCPAATAAPYARALAAGGRYLLLGQQLQARYRDIRRADDLGDAVALTPDYRGKVKKAKELYQQLLNDYREMRVAFYDQLGAEMRHASCKTGPAATKPSATAATAAEPPAAPNPTDPDAWTIIDEGVERPASPPGPAATAAKPASPERAPLEAAPEPAGSTLAAPAIWIDLDNSLCTQPTRVSIDGQALGEVAPHKKTSVRTHAGPREICVLPAGDARACGDPGTIRKAYLHEGWSLSVHCENN